MDDIANLEPKLEQAHDALAAVDQQLPDVSAAINLLAQRMQVLGDAMTPDDLIVELTCERDGNTAKAHLRFRAYKRRPTE